MAAGQGGHRHPEHDRLVRAVRGWYATSYPAMGYHTERRRYGYYTVNPRIPGGFASRVVLRDVAPEQVPECLADARRYFVDAPILSGWRDLGAVLALEGLFFLVVVSGWGGFYLPVALGLVLSGVVVACTLALALLVLLLGREGRYARLADVAGVGSAALLLGYAALALIAAGRFYLEHVTGMGPMG